MQRPAVLILTSDAREYLPLLDGLAGGGIALTAAETAGDAREKYAGQSVILGQPDLVAELSQAWELYAETSGVIRPNEPIAYAKPAAPGKY